MTPPPSAATALGLVAQGAGSKRTVTATLTADGTGVAGKTIQFFADGVAIGSATTNTSGAATINPPSTYRSSKTVFGACFAGDGGYSGSSAGSGSVCG
jgi:hypothetical protein